MADELEAQPEPEAPPQDDPTSDEDQTDSHLLSFPIAAIGASAGGLEAYLELFASLPADTGVAFVVIQHLPAEPKSDLTTILSQRTSMPVLEIEHGLKPEPNHVYVAPGNVWAYLRRGVFQTTPRPEYQKLSMPIDRFFRSLASDQRNRSIGVIMSGLDSDGALGLKAIKGEGGITIVQDPESARYEDMPRSGILADRVDLVLPPSQIAHELSRLARQFFQPSLQHLEQGALSTADEPHFARIISLLRTVSGIDFRNYKPATICRRMARRMILRRVEHLSEYARHVFESAEELRNLHEDVLIGVTRFFRDPQVFDVLKAEILPALFDNRPPDQQVRIWVAGCSTGEEAYSIAMCVLEFLAGRPHEPPIQIFGTDASDSSIDKARAGLFPESIATEISTERLRRFFVKTDKGFQVSKRVRDLCIFARQNLCSDPPFSRLDMVSCRNVLIYLQPEAQRAVIGVFYYSLRPTGVLLLGRSESVPDNMGLFTPVDRKARFYAKLGESHIQAAMLASRNVMPDGPNNTSLAVRTAHSMVKDLDAQRAADRALLSRYAPPGVVVNQQAEVVEVRGRAAPFVAMSPGTASLQLFRMVHPDVAPTVRQAFRRVLDSGSPVSEPVTVHEGDNVHSAILEILPLHENGLRVANYLVLFVPVYREPENTKFMDLMSRVETIDVSDPDRVIEKLNRDLSTTRLYLQSLIEERDSRNQELTAAYEEIQSANEELQSTNEELETAKEELQSTNEELQTVNEELRNRNVALIHASNDLTNLLNSVNIPVIMLGPDFTIRRFTPPAERMMRLRPADMGRPIGEIRLNLMLEDIEPLLHEVLDTLATKELDVQDRTGRWHLLRLRPYRTTDNKIEGVVLLLLDVDQIRRSQKELEHARDFAQTVVEAVQVPVVVLNSQLRIRSANAAFRSLANLHAADLDRRSFAELMTMLWDWPDLRAGLEDLAAKPVNETSLMQVEHAASRPANRHFRMTARAVVSESQHAILVILEDITPQRQAERLLEADRERLAGQVETTREVLGRTRGELHALAARLFNSQEDERRRVSRELHDDISQKLAALEMDLNHLRKGLPEGTDGVRTDIESMRQRVAALSSDVRAISHQLHPSSLDHLGLVTALRSLVRDFGEREGMVATFRASKIPDHVHPKIATVLYRVAQEALRNVAKHAGRTHVRVSLEEAKEELTLTVRDLGEGFDMDGEECSGLGLVSMAERARLVGGFLTVQSALGQGTTVSVKVPLTNEESHN